MCVPRTQSSPADVFGVVPELRLTVFSVIQENAAASCGQAAYGAAARCRVQRRNLGRGRSKKDAKQDERSFRDSSRGLLPWPRVLQNFRKSAVDESIDCERCVPISTHPHETRRLALRLAVAAEKKACRSLFPPPSTMQISYDASHA